MKTVKIFGFILLAVLWVWLVRAIFADGVVTLYKIFVAGASAIIIFVPLYRKYISGGEINKK